MDYQGIKKRLYELKNAYGKICDRAELELEGAATESEIRQLEEKIGMCLPKELREFFLCFSRRCVFNAFLPDDLKLPDELGEIFSSCFVFSLAEVAEAESCRKDWQENCFPDEEDAYDQVWHHKLGIMTVGNGDVIALDIGKDSENPPVVYLSHDDGEGHGYVLGKTFYSYLEALLLVGGCGNEDWQMLPFCHDVESGIDPRCENADAYRKIIGLNEFGK